MNLNQVSILLIIIKNRQILHFFVVTFSTKFPDYYLPEEASTGFTFCNSPDAVKLYSHVCSQRADKGAPYGHNSWRWADSAVDAEEMEGPWNWPGWRLERGIHGLPVLPKPQQTQQGHCRWVNSLISVSMSRHFHFEFHLFHHVLLISVNPSDTVLYTAREKEKPYTSDQEDPDVVQPYAAYSPPGHAKVNDGNRHNTHVVSLKLCLKLS